MNFTQYLGIFFSAILIGVVLIGCEPSQPNEVETRPETASETTSSNTTAWVTTDTVTCITCSTVSDPPESIPGTEQTDTESVVGTETESESQSTHEHSYTTETTVASTCTEKGYTIYRCSECGYSYTKYKSIAAHSYGSWNIIKEPTCEKTGLRSHTCSVCGKTASQKLSKIKCCYADATCAKPKICIWCKESDGEPHYHKWDEGRWLTIKEPSGEGELLYTCSVCGDTHTVIIDKALPSELTDNFVIRSLTYLGHDVSGQIKAGDLFSVFGAFELSKKYRSQVFYDENAASGLEGINMISSPDSSTGKLPDLEKFKAKGLVCASFTAYFLFNYLPNIENIDTGALQSAFLPYIEDLGYHYRAVLTWKLAFEDLSAQGTVEKIGTSLENVDREKLSVGDIIIFSSEKYRYSHIAIYAGSYRGEDYVAHCTWKRGVEINTLSAIADPYGDPELLGSKPSAFYHIDYKSLENKE